MKARMAALCDELGFAISSEYETSCPMTTSIAAPCLNSSSVIPFRSITIFLSCVVVPLRVPSKVVIEEDRFLPVTFESATAAFDILFISSGVYPSASSCATMSSISSFAESVFLHSSWFLLLLHHMPTCPWGLQDKNYCTYEELAGELQRGCGWTAKKNSQGKFEWFRGYKFHFLTDDNGCIAAYEIARANVADSSVSIAPKKKCPLTYASTVEDKGYDSFKLSNYADDTGHVAIIDRRNDTNCSKMTPFHREVYKTRTTVERSNGELKECFLPSPRI